MHLVFMEDWRLYLGMFSTGSVGGFLSGNGKMDIIPSGGSLSLMENISNSRIS